MVKAWSVVLGIGLVLLGLAGLGGAPGGMWIAWLDFVAALGSFLVAGLASSEPTASARRFSGPALISAGLFCMWVIALATASVAAPLTWWNFAFACAYGLLAVGASTEQRAGAATPVAQDRDRDKPRHAA